MALGKSLQEIRTLPSAELTLWRAYEELHGLPQTRTEATIAIGASAICNCLGSRCKPKDLLPTFESTKVVSSKEGMELFGAWAKAHNEQINGKHC